ncbi:hypothetical protein KFE25_009568 [Diacronema lutheri]|uniref:ShKT domain-containing protein n=1 Tax=Diacronema lutheri TaxID=2081491 RepID=A0A8J5XYH7_DIALT|nr:hypothetical protein KFE25_009568 [Diacronema lutheri]
MVVLRRVALLAACALAVERGCEDDHASCYEWALQGECGRNSPYMERYCPSSCGLCPGMRAVVHVPRIQRAFSSWRAGRESVNGEGDVQRVTARRRLAHERLNLLSPEEPALNDGSGAEEGERQNNAAQRRAPTDAPVHAHAHAPLRAAADEHRAVADGGLPRGSADDGGRARAAESRGAEAEAEGEGEAEAAEEAGDEDDEGDEGEYDEDEGEQAGPLDWIEPRHIVYLFELSGLAQIASHALTLLHARTVRTSLEGVSVKTLQLQLAAVLSRGAFCCTSHFGAHWIVRIELPAAAVLLLLLLRAHARRPVALVRRTADSAADSARRQRDLSPVAGPGGGGGFGAGPLARDAHGAASRPSADDNFPLRSVCAACALLAAGLSLVTSYGLVTYATLAFSIFVEAAALVPQRRLLVATSRVSSLSGHAVLLLALSRAIRLLMWAVLYHEGDTQHALMLADAAHCVMLGRFVHDYVRILVPRIVVPI